MTKLSFYILSPIFHWQGFATEAQALFELKSGPREQLGDVVKNYEVFRAKAFEAVVKLWGEKYSQRFLVEGPYVSMLPDGNLSADALPLLAWTVRDELEPTFAANPYQLPWLDKQALERAVIEW